MKHLFLDFDGVVSPFIRVNTDVIPCISDSGFDISYLEYVIEWINDKVADPEWKVYWLTTWVDRIQELDKTGVSSKIEVIHKTKDDILINHGHLWKPEAGIKKYHEIINENLDDIVIWIDDDSRIVNHPSLTNIVSFSPNKYRGLTREELDTIDKL